MKFRYSGGDCSQSFNIQPRSLFECFDFNGGPPTANDFTSYIIATALKDEELVYFEGLVNTTDIYTLYDGGNRFEANMDITIYNPRGETDPALIKTTANLLQAVQYHSSCSSNLFLKDRFGSNQLVEFTNEIQGTVTCFVTATVNITLENPQGSGVEINLLELNSVVNFDPFTINKDVDVIGMGPLLEGMTFSPTPIVVTLDLSARQSYIFFTTVVGEPLDGSTEQCNGVHLFEFDAGNLPIPDRRL
jgi:hypothetical protein